MSVKFARGVRGRFSAVGWKLAPIVGWQVLTCEWNAEGFGWEEARITIWGWALVAPIETEGRDWACQCEGVGTAIQGCGLRAFGMERTRQRLNYELLLAVRNHLAARNEPQSDLSTARPLTVRLEGASLALARARTAHWWARHRLCIQGFVCLVG